MADLDASQAGRKQPMPYSNALRKEGREALVCLPDAPILQGKGKLTGWMC